jgi:hypothetical protein
MSAFRSLHGAPLRRSRLARASKPSSVTSTSQIFAPFSTGRKLVGDMQLKMTNVTEIGVDLAVKRVSCLQAEDRGWYWVIASPLSGPPDD